jgi:hypothetical protein
VGGISVGVTFKGVGELISGGVRVMIEGDVPVGIWSEVADIGAQAASITRKHMNDKERRSMRKL